MARRKNNLNERELSLVRKSSKSYVESFKEALNLFVDDCELRNLRPFTIRYYQNEIHAFLNQLEKQGIDTNQLKPNNVKGSLIEENVILYMRKYKGAKVVSINTRLWALRSIFNFLYNKKHIKNNPMKKRKAFEG
nr:site-specific integrase [Bacillus weihaiensis]